MKSFYMLTLLSITFTMLQGQTPVVVDTTQPTTKEALALKPPLSPEEAQSMKTKEKESVPVTATPIKPVVVGNEVSAEITKREAPATVKTAEVQKPEEIKPAPKPEEIKPMPKPEEVKPIPVSTPALATTTLETPVAVKAAEVPAKTEEIKSITEPKLEIKTESTPIPASEMQLITPASESKVDPIDPPAIADPEDTVVPPTFGVNVKTEPAAFLEKKVEAENPVIIKENTKLIQLKKKLGEKYLELSKLGQSIAFLKHVKAIKQLRRRINNLEAKYGIKQLQAKIGAMKIKACAIQQLPELKKIYSQIEALQNEVKDLTGDEQAEIEKLAAQKIQKDDPKYKEYKANLEELNNKIQEKAAPQLEKILKLNEEILKNPENAKIIAAVKESKLGTKLKKKLEALKETIKPIDEEISKHIEELNAADKNEQIKQIRIDIKKIKNEIMKYDPCFSAKESLKDRGWLEYFVF